MKVMKLTYIKQQLFLNLFSFFKIPLLFFCRPKIVKMADDEYIVKIPLGWRTKNHIGSMYFGALSVGADLSGGLIMLNLLQQRKQNVTFLFKDFKADFLKRAEGDVYFSCRDITKVKALLEKANKTKEREHVRINVTATVPDKLEDEPVAEFVLTLSVKNKS